MRTPGPIRLVVSDVDGTLVTKDKRLTSATIDAVHALHARGILFAVVSSRPPRGMAMLVAPLGITTALAGFNGGEIVRPDQTPLANRHLPHEAAEMTIAELSRADVDIWVFAGSDWLVTNPAGPYVAHEEHTVVFAPKPVADFAPYLDGIGKIVGSSKDFDRLAAIEADLQNKLGDRATARRSQHYYLDVTNKDANKGRAACTLAELFGVPLAETACIGDMANDIPMLDIAGLSVAMGNAPSEVQAHAQFVTSSNEEDGFAHAMERHVLPRAP